MSFVALSGGFLTWKRNTGDERLVLAETLLIRGRIPLTEISRSQSPRGDHLTQCNTCPPVR